MQVRLPSHLIDFVANELRTLAGEPVNLRARSYSVLRLLAENAGQVVTKDEIMTKVWGDVFVTEDSLTQCIADIRKAIGDEDRRILRTVARRGYVLVPVQRFAGEPARGADKPLLAVRPFLLLQERSEMAWGHGLSCELICELARNKDLRVLSRDSSLASGGGKTSQEIGQMLGARYLVEGDAQRFNGTLMIDVQLVDARDSIIIWADRFTAKSADIPQVRWSIVEKIAATLHSAMREAEKSMILARPPGDLDVYELTLRGMARKHQFTAESFSAGRADLAEAIRRDPNYAPAWIYLGWLNAIDMCMQLTGEWPPARVEEAIAQFNRGIELDPNVSAGYQGLSMTLALLVGDATKAVSLALRGVELGPSDADALLFLAVALFEAGELEEAETVVEKAIQLNPVRPSYFCYFYARILWASRRYQEALEQIEDCLRKAPTFWLAGLYRVVVLVELGRLGEARSGLAEYLSKGWPVIPPHAPVVASRFMAALQTAGWRPVIATERAG